MSVKTAHAGCDQFYFCTFTCKNWLNLFTVTGSFDQVFRWFTVAEEWNYKIVAYVIMPNHLHFVIHTPQQKTRLNTLVGNGKRFMAYAIVNRLEAQNESAILKQLENAVTPSDRRRGKLHQVFEPSFDARRIFSEEMLIQKINYMHHNPVCGKWRLVDDFVRYPYSSAAFYELGETGLYPVTHYAKILYGEEAIL